MAEDRARAMLEDRRAEREKDREKRERGVAWVVAEDRIRVWGEAAVKQKIVEERRGDAKEKTKTKNENVISAFSFFVQILKTFL